jgi:hypothetical protein
MEGSADHTRYVPNFGTGSIHAKTQMRGSSVTVLRLLINANLWSKPVGKYRNSQTFLLLRYLNPELISFSFAEPGQRSSLVSLFNGVSEVLISSWSSFVSGLM